MLTYGAFEGAIGRSSVPPGFTGNVKDFEKDRLLSSRKVGLPYLNEVSRFIVTDKGHYSDSMAFPLSPPSGYGSS